MTLASPIVSVVIPAFNRVAPLQATLRSAERAVRRLSAPAEILVVDDGSTPPLESRLAGVVDSALVRFTRQPNQGSIVARLTGLAAARGEFVLFLDSDDCVSEDKLRRHCETLAADPGLALTYDDVGASENPSDPASPVQLVSQLDHATDLPDLVLRVQPLPHGCVYRRPYLNRALARPVVAPRRDMDPSGDVWLYYNLSVHPASFAKIDGALTFVGVHDEGRYSQCWERLGVASLLLAERFMAATAASAAEESVRRAREVAGECAFRSWRKLPRDFSPAYTDRLLAVWRSAPRGQLAQLGGPLFRTLATALGPVAAGRLLRLRNGDYASCRTLDDAALGRLLAS